jgi:hypothetical protein
MWENEKAKLQYRARFHEETKAVNKLHYDIVSIKKLTKRQRKNRRYHLNKTKASNSASLGVSENGPPKK